MDLDILKNSYSKFYPKNTLKSQRINNNNKRSKNLVYSILAFKII